VVHDASMAQEYAFRSALIVALLAVFPIMLYHRIKAHRSREPLDRRQEGVFILATLRPVGLLFIVSLIVYLVNPARMAWSAIALPAWVRWSGLAAIAVAGALLFWTLHSLGPNLTDTVVTRKTHTLVVKGPYRWVRHPFYDAVALLLFAISLVAANWFLLLMGTIVLTLLVVRTPREEARLVARFGDQYRSYMAHTNRFVPALGAGRRVR
jgi:protein-S-isoprenylcysteine O-methyltransferase Ste14